MFRSILTFYTAELRSTLLLINQKLMHNFCTKKCNNCCLITSDVSLQFYVSIFIIRPIITPYSIMNKFEIVQTQPGFTNAQRMLVYKTLFFFTEFIGHLRRWIKKASRRFLSYCELYVSSSPTLSTCYRGHALVCNIKPHIKQRGIKIKRNILSNMTQKHDAVTYDAIPADVLTCTSTKNPYTF
jgi:hypothetical protein